LTFAAQGFAIGGAGLLARDITAITGEPSNANWFTIIIGLGAVVLQAPTSQAADYWGRKVFMTFFSAMGVVGCIIVSRAQNPATTLAGFAILSLSSGTQALGGTICSEVLPRKYRSYGSAAYQSSASFGVMIGVTSAGALVRNSHPAGFRTYFYITAGIYALATLLVLFCYNPPLRELQKSLTFSQKIRRLDWIAYFLLVSGLLLICLGLSWSLNPYHWSNAHVSVPFALGLTLLLTLIVYSWRIKKDGMINHGLFQHRNFALILLCIFAEGVAFFCANNFQPLTTVVFFTTDLLYVALHMAVAMGASVYFACAAGLYSKKTKTVRSALAVSFIFFTVYGVVMATVTPSTPGAAFWVYQIFEGAGLGICLMASVVAAQFATPLELISTATGLLLTVRNFGGTVGIAIFSALLNSGMSSLGANIAAKTLPMGLPPSSLGPLISNLVASNYAALAQIPGVTPEIIGAASEVLLNNYKVGLRNGWIFTAAASALAVVCKYAPSHMQPRYG
jgi:MFS family permease